jgi:Kinesin motor domain
VDKFLGGANACLLAYGQTASGKTYTSGTDGAAAIECWKESVYYGSFGFVLESL